MRGNEGGKRENRTKEHGETPRNKKVGTRSDASAGASACEKLTICRGDVSRFAPMEESLPHRSMMNHNFNTIFHAGYTQLKMLGTIW